VIGSPSAPAVDEGASTAASRCRNLN